MGRIWQHFLLQKAYPIFEFVPIEQVIRNTQKNYYIALEKSDDAGETTPFVEYMLEAILSALMSTVQPKNFEVTDVEVRLEKAKEHFGSTDFSRAEYIAAVGVISSATASRDLKHGVQRKVLKIIGNNRMSRYQF